jgi:hypothetical protein
MTDAASWPGTHAYSRAATAIDTLGLEGYRLLSFGRLGS